MPTFQDHNRRTPAANADILGEDADLAVTQSAPDGGPVNGKGAGPDATGANPSRNDAGEARPGRDINQAGFVHERDGPRS